MKWEEHRLWHSEIIGRRKGLHGLLLKVKIWDIVVAKDRQDLHTSRRKILSNGSSREFLSHSRQSLFPWAREELKKRDPGALQEQKNRVPRGSISFDWYRSQGVFGTFQKWLFTVAVKWGHWVGHFLTDKMPLRENGCFYPRVLILTKNIKKC